MGEEGGLGEGREGRGKGKEETVGREGVVDMWMVFTLDAHMQTKNVHDDGRLLITSPRLIAKKATPM